MNKRIIAVMLLIICVPLLLSINLDKPVKTLMPTYTNQASQFIDIDGMSVHYRIEGLQDATAPTLLLLHGSNASLHTWEGWVAELGDQYRLVSIDLPGHGLTGPHPKKLYSWKDTAVFLKKFVTKLELNAFVLAGNSRGGAISWNYTILYPNDVSHLILIDSAGIPSDEEMPFMLKLQTLPVISTLSNYVTPLWVVAGTVDQVYGDQNRVTEEKVQLYIDMTLREGNRAANSYRLSQPWDLSLLPKLSEITAPTLILWGEKDTWILPKFASIFKEKIPHASLIMYPDLGHVPMEEAPKRTADDVLAFIKNTQATTEIQ